jgi:hypothetical protein
MKVPRGSETTLVVEDAVTVGQLVVELLKENGDRLLVAAIPKPFKSTTLFPRRGRCPRFCVLEVIQKHVRAPVARIQVLKSYR